MNKKFISFSLMSSILTSLNSGVVGAWWENDLKDKIDKSVKIEFKNNCFETAKLRDIVYDKNLGILDENLVLTEKTKKAIEDAREAIMAYKQLLLDLAWSKENYMKDKEVIKTKLNKQEKETKRLVNKVEQMLEENSYRKNICLPWDDIDGKYNFLFNTENDDDLDETNKEDILKKLTVVTENEKEDQDKSEYVKKCLEVANLRKELKKKGLISDDSLRKIKDRLFTAYNESQSLMRKILLKEVEDKSVYGPFRYPLVLYRDGLVPKSIIDKINKNINECSRFLECFIEKIQEISGRDAYFKGKKPEYIYGENGGRTSYDSWDWEKDKENWFGKQRKGELDYLLATKKVLNSYKKKTDSLAYKYDIILPWHKIKSKKYGFLFDLKNNRKLDTIIPDKDIKNRYFEKVMNGCSSTLKIKTEKNKLLEAIDYYSNEIAKERDRIRTKETICLSDKINLIRLYQAKKMLEKKIRSKEESNKRSLLDIFLDALKEMSINSIKNEANYN